MKIVSLLTAFLLASAPAWAQGAFLGVQVSPADGGGVELESVNPDTAAEIMGLAVGDRLVAIDGKAVAGVDDFVKRIGQRLPGEIVRFELVRDGQPLSMRGVLGRRPGLRGLRVPAVPGQRGLPQPMEIPDLPEAWTFEVPELELPGAGLDAWHEWMDPEQLRGLEEQIQQLREHGRFRSFSGGDLDSGFQLQIAPGVPGGEREVHVRYPGSTPEGEREAMIREAKRKYGEEAEVVFEGEGSSVSIVTRSGGGFGGDVDLLDALRQGEDGRGGLILEWEEAAPVPEVEPEEIIEEIIEEPVLQESELHEVEIVDAGPAAAWHGSLEQALAAARESGKPVLLDFSAEWCGPCRMLGSELLHNPAHAGLIGRFEPVQVDIDAHRELAEKFEVSGIPDLRILRADGSQVHKVVGYGGVESAVQQLETGLKKAAASGDTGDPRLERLREHREQLQEELERARRQLEELRKELGGEESPSES